MAYTLDENAVAYFIRFASGKALSFNTAEERAAVVAEIEADEAAWRAA